LHGPVERLAREHALPAAVDLSSDEIAVNTVDQYYVTVDHDRGGDTARLLYQNGCPPALVFCRPGGTDALHRKLSAKPPASVIHGDLHQTVRKASGNSATGRRGC
jgi:ATP-dependent RNA helicase DeaD